MKKQKRTNLPTWAFPGQVATTQPFKIPVRRLGKIKPAYTPANIRRACRIGVRS